MWNKIQSVEVWIAWWWVNCIHVIQFVVPLSRFMKFMCRDSSKTPKLFSFEGSDSLSASCEDQQFDFCVNNALHIKQRPLFCYLFSLLSSSIAFVVCWAFLSVLLVSCILQVMTHDRSLYFSQLNVYNNCENPSSHMYIYMHILSGNC